MWRKSVYLLLILGGLLASLRACASPAGASTGGSLGSGVGVFRPQSQSGNPVEAEPSLAGPPEPDRSARFRPIQKPRIRSATTPAESPVFTPGVPTVSPVFPGFTPTPPIYAPAYPSAPVLPPVAPGYSPGYPGLGYPGMNMFSPYALPPVAPVLPAPYAAMPYTAPVYPMPFAPAISPYWGGGW